MEVIRMKWFTIDTSLAKKRVCAWLRLIGMIGVFAFLKAETMQAHTSSVAIDTIANAVLSDTLPQIPDSVIISRARALGMVDTAEVNARLQRLHRIEAAFADMVDTAAWSHGSLRYIKNKEKAYKHWMRLIPNQFTMQYAGSIGLLSVGFGWHYGHNDHWETDLLLGFVPRYHSGVAHATYTIKERYIPWHCRLSSRWTLQPLTAGLFFNTISGNDFWRKLPDKYPKKYYGFSTKVRSNIFLGQRLRYRIPSRRRVFHSAVNIYYELSSCDLYIVSKAVNKSYPWRETLSLAFGMRWEM